MTSVGLVQSQVNLAQLQIGGYHVLAMHTQANSSNKMESEREKAEKDDTS